MKRKLDDEMVKVKFNFACYLSEEDNPFETKKLLQKANGFGPGIEFVMDNMMNEGLSDNIVNPGKIVNIKYSLAKKYLNTTHKRMKHKFGLIGSYAQDSGWIREVPLAELVESHEVENVTL